MTPAERGEGKCPHAQAGACSFCYESSQATIRELVEALKGARRILSIYVTDDSPQEDILDANMIDQVIAKAKEGRG